MTNNTNIEGLPPLPDGYDGYRYGVPEKGGMYHNGCGWILSTTNMATYWLIATRTPLWYPESWRDDMENVFEVKAGEWPPCAPSDKVLCLLIEDREARKSGAKSQLSAAYFNWTKDTTIVAIRIIERAKP